MTGAQLFISLIDSTNSFIHTYVLFFKDNHAQQICQEFANKQTKVPQLNMTLRDGIWSIICGSLVVLITI